MFIRINDVVGERTHDLDNINNLNHYIGMKRIEPDAIPELRIMPWLIGALAALGLASAWAGRRWLLVVWVLAFTAIAVVGLVDFHLWEYDYGHNLHTETAIIKIPGMNYQPPLIGSKQLLNFVASSWPAAGGWLAFVSLGAGWVIAFLEMRLRSRRADTSKTIGAPVLLAAGLAVLSGCAPEPAAIRYGSDGCAYCKMTVTDERYGAELVTHTGKVQVFDSIECLVSYLIENPDVPVQSLWVTPYNSPGSLIAAENALILHSPNLRSPMGMNLTAFGDGMTPDAATQAFAGSILTWDEVRARVSVHTFGVDHHPVFEGTVAP
jgi:copper chaperone NosL